MPEYGRVRKWWMKKFGVQFMLVPDEVRKTCDRYGEQVIGAMLAGGFNPSTADLQAVYQTAITQQDARDWLTERNSIREYRERWIPLRDLILEILVVGLIGWEIIEGREQAKILGQVSTSVQVTATETKGVNVSAQDQATNLKKLTEEETKSLSSLREMNDELQSSLKLTSDMTLAMREQLQILKEEQASRQAELAKKPKLEMYIGSILLTPNSFLRATARQSTDDRCIYDVSLKNAGNATATKGTLRVVLVGKGVWFESTTSRNRAYEPPESDAHTYLIPFDYLRANVQIPMSFTIGYPKGEEAGVVVYFSVDVDELPAGTPLGNLIVLPPPKPKS